MIYCLKKKKEEESGRSERKWRGNGRGRKGKGGGERKGSDALITPRKVQSEGELLPLVFLIKNHMTLSKKHVHSCGKEMLKVSSPIIYAY